MRSARSTPRGRPNATVSRAGDRYVISGLTRAGARPSWSTSLAIRGERVAARRHADQEAAHRAVRAAEQHGRRLDEVGARALRLRVRERHHAPTSPATSAIASTCSSSATSARGVLPGGGFGRPAATAPTGDDDEARDQGARRVRARRRHAGRDERQRGGGDRSVEAAGQERARPASPASSSSPADR